METSILKMVANFVKNSLNTRSNNKKYDFVFYEIIDFEYNKHLCTIKCVNTSKFFMATITEIVFDEDILYFLHPVHACFIGIEYARALKNSKNEEGSNPKREARQDPTYRYGDYQVLYKNRKGNLCFMQTNTKDEFVMDPRDIVLSNELIQEFDSSQAFYIGLEAGLKIDNKVSNENYDILSEATVNKRPHLRVVK